MGRWGSRPVDAGAQGFAVVVLCDHGVSPNWSPSTNALCWTSALSDVAHMTVLRGRDALAPDNVELERLFAGSELPLSAPLTAVVKRLAGSAYPILLLGERGTGKTTLAQHIHTISGRAGAFVPYQLGAATSALHANDLFGHAKGAFTGADRARDGLIDYAHEGTLFLDELGTANRRLQGTLLSLFDSGYYRRQGEDRTRRVTCRIIAATNRNLDRRARRGLFRADLLDRFGYFRIEMPPLRTRKADIRNLFRRRLAIYCGISMNDVALSEELADLLVAAPWPGNLRQLDHIARYVALVSDGHGEISVAHLPPAFLRGLYVDPSEDDGSLDTRIERALRESNGNVSLAAKRLSISRRTIQRHKVGSASMKVSSLSDVEMTRSPVRHDA